MEEMKKGIEEMGAAVPTNEIWTEADTVDAALQVNVKEAVGTVETSDRSTGSEPFIRAQQIDIEAAYKRVRITQDIMNAYKEEINRTNTSDIAGSLRVLYEDLQATMKAIIREEKQLIALSE